MTGLFDPNINLPARNVVKDASVYGKQLAHWDGVDLNVDARLRNGLFLQGGVSTGKTMTDNCDIVDDAPEILGPQSPSFCHFETPFLPQYKALASYTLPYGIRVSGTLAELHPAADRGEQHLQQRQPADLDDAAAAVHARAGRT